MIVYQLGLKSKFRLMCEGEYNNSIRSVGEPPSGGLKSLNSTHSKVGELGKD